MNSRNSSQYEISPWVIRLNRFLTAMWIVAGVDSVLKADEFPPLCSRADGGLGATSVSRIGFGFQTAHVGDTVPVYPTLGMVYGACQAQHATGTVYIASGLLVKFLEDATLDPGNTYECPGLDTPPCIVGPYNVTITPDLVGAGVLSPGGSVPGVPNQVRAIEWSRSDYVRTGDPDDTFVKFESASLTIVTPCIQVFRTCSFHAGSDCFGPGDAVQFVGYVTNCGVITLTNLTAIDNRAGPLVLLDPNAGFPLNPDNPLGPIILPAGAVATFTSSFNPSLLEISAGSASSTIVVRGTDTSDIGGPRASVTNYVTTPCAICVKSVLISRPWIANGLFTFSFMTDSNRTYIVSYTDSLSSTNWRPKTNFTGDGTVATFLDRLSSTQRYYRVQTQ